MREARDEQKANAAHSKDVQTADDITTSSRIGIKVLSQATTIDEDDDDAETESGASIQRDSRATTAEYEDGTKRQLGPVTERFCTKAFTEHGKSCPSERVSRRKSTRRGLNKAGKGGPDRCSGHQ